ncbi:hypothetical protein GMMP1_950001 [Candidatus Magnetomoraceae bacterium gMMP-1]
MHDYSDYFSIIEEPKIEVEVPDSGEKWEKGVEYTIEWEDNISENVKIELYKDSSFKETIKDSTSSDGRFDWTVPTDVSADDDYRIKITSKSNSDISKYSDYFSITEKPNQAPTINISSPDSNQNFQSPDITVSGTASDQNGSVTLVQIKVNDGEWQNASGTTNWSLKITLQEGKNTIYARAKDNDEQYSSSNSSVAVNYQASVGTYCAYFEEAGQHYEIPFNILKALAHVESGWDQSQQGTNGNSTDWGIMQINDKDNKLFEVAKALRDGWNSYYGWNDYNGMSDQDIVNLLKADTDDGAKANIRGGAYLLRNYDDDDIYECEPLEALEVWWFPLARYNGGGYDGKLTTSNYPFRVYNCFLTGKDKNGNNLPENDDGFNDTNCDVRVPKIPITLPPHITFRRVANESREYSEIVSSDANLIPKTPPFEKDNKNNFVAGFIRRTETFNSCTDMRVMHNNNGQEIYTSNIASCSDALQDQPDPFKLSFPLKDQTPETASITSVFDYCQGGIKTATSIYKEDGYVMAYTGEYGFWEYGSNRVDIKGYKKSNGKDFVVNGNYTAGCSYTHCSDYLYYEGHPGVDYSATHGVKLYATADGIFHIDLAPNKSGNLTKAYIDHGNGYRTYYLHCQKFEQQNGKEVKAGDLIGESGDEGAEAPHLHLEIKKDGYPLDPYGWHGNLPQDDPQWTRATNSILWSNYDHPDDIGGSDPTSPYNLVASPISLTEINLSWLSPTDVSPTQYYIYRDDVFIESVSATQTNYKDTELIKETEYSYHVTAMINGEESNPSNKVNAITLEEDQTILSVTPLIRNVSAIANSTTFHVSNIGTGSMEWMAEVDSNDSWLTIVSDSNIITATYESNSSDARTERIKITAIGATGSPKYIEVKQKSGLNSGDGGTFLNEGSIPGEQKNADWNTYGDGYFIGEDDIYDQYNTSVLSGCRTMYWSDSYIVFHHEVDILPSNVFEVTLAGKATNTTGEIGIDVFISTDGTNWTFLGITPGHDWQEYKALTVTGNPELQGNDLYVKISPASQPATAVIYIEKVNIKILPFQTGSLTVTISPQDAVIAGAMWRVDQGTWMNSGDTQTDLSIVDTHVLEFKSISGWNHSVTANVVINNDQTTVKQAAYTQNINYTLNLSKDGNGQIQVNEVLHNLPWTKLFIADSEVNLEAVPATDWEFVFWSGLGTDNPINITMDDNKSIKANFVQKLPEISVFPDSFDFGNVNTESQSTAQTFTVSNIGKDDLMIETISIAGTDNFNFAMQNNHCSNRCLSASENCMLEILFLPTAQDTFHDSNLVIPSNDSYSPTVLIPLIGTGVTNCSFDIPEATITSMEIFGKIYDESNQLIADGDEIAAFVDDGNGELLIVGYGIYGENVSGDYGLIHIYEDDTTTPEKDGAIEDDTIILKTCNKSEGNEYTLILISGNNTWTEGIQKECNWRYPAQQIKQRIPLHRGWNLISFGVNKCYYVGNKPTVDMIEGIEYEQVNSIQDILSTIDGKYSYVRGFDITGAKSYNLSPWSDMRYMAVGYGYWIKVNKDADVDENGLIYLELEGTYVPSDKPILLKQGWNLVGHLGKKIRYRGPEPAVHYPKGSVKHQLISNNIAEAFSSIDGRYSYIRGFDETGAKSYNLSPWSDMRYVGPGYGYWIKINSGEKPVLIWE